MHRHHHFFGDRHEHRGRHAWGGRMGRTADIAGAIAAAASAGSWNTATFASWSWPCSPSSRATATS